MNPYPANTFGSENNACSLCLLHIFLCSMDSFCHGSKQYKPDQTAPKGLYLLQNRLPKDNSR